MLGTKQSGLPDFKLANLEEDGDLLTIARKTTDDIMQTDPQLRQDPNEALKHLLYLFEYDTQVKYLRS